MSAKLTLSIALVLALVGCSASPPEAVTNLLPQEGQTAVAGAFTATAEPVHAHPSEWDYEGERGPANWGGLTLKDKTNDCGATHQSPIDIVSGQADGAESLTLNYQPRNLITHNTGHTVQAEAGPEGPAGGFIELGGQRYSLQQFHYHAPSEHTLDGRQFDAELHFVHKLVGADGAPGDKLAVISVLLETGAENSALQPFLANLPAEVDARTDTGVTISAADLLPGSHQTFRYTGSLTTPPCTEGVSWIVMQTPVQISADQLTLLQNVFNGNTRPIQPLNDRSILADPAP